MNYAGILGLSLLVLASPVVASAQGTTTSDANSRFCLHVDFALSAALDSPQSYSGTFVAFPTALTPVNAVVTYPTLGTNRAAQFGAAFLVWRHLGVRLNFRTVSSTKVAGLKATAPHPFLMLPTASDEVSFDSQRRDITIDLDAVFDTPIGNKVRLGVFAGPTRFSVTQEMNNRISYSQTFDPTGSFNSINLSESALRNEEVSASVWGYNLGGDLSFFPHRRIGLGVQVSYARGSVTMRDPLTGSEAELVVGGVTLGVGLRLRF